MNRGSGKRLANCQSFDDGEEHAPLFFSTAALKIAVEDDHIMQIRNDIAP